MWQVTPFCLTVDVLLINYENLVTIKKYGPMTTPAAKPHQSVNFNGSNGDSLTVWELRSFQMRQIFLIDFNHLTRNELNPKTRTKLNKIFYFAEGQRPISWERRWIQFLAFSRYKTFLYLVVDFKLRGEKLLWKRSTTVQIHWSLGQLCRRWNGASALWISQLISAILNPWSGSTRFLMTCQTLMNKSCQIMTPMVHLNLVLFYIMEIL